MSTILNFKKAFFFFVFSFFLAFSQEEVAENTQKQEVKKTGTITFTKDGSLQMESLKDLHSGFFRSKNQFVVSQGMFTLSADIWLTYYFNASAAGLNKLDYGRDPGLRDNATFGSNGEASFAMNNMFLQASVLPNLFLLAYHGRILDEYGTYYKSFAYIAKPLFNDNYLNLNGFGAIFVPVASAAMVVKLTAGGSMSKYNTNINMAEYFAILDTDVNLNQDLKVSGRLTYFAIDDVTKVGSDAGHFDFDGTNNYHVGLVGLKVSHKSLGIDFFATFESDDMQNNFMDTASSAVGLAWSDTMNIPFFDKINMEWRIPYTEENPTLLATLLGANPVLGVYADLQLSHQAFYSKFYFQYDLTDDNKKANWGSVIGLKFPVSLKF